MRKQYLLFMATFLCFFSVSCASKSGKLTNNNYQKNYMEGSQSEVDKNVQQLEKRREADEKKIDVFDYEQNRPK